MSGIRRLVAVVTVLCAPAAALGQQTTPPDSPNPVTPVIPVAPAIPVAPPVSTAPLASTVPDDADVVVCGLRGSVIRDVQPLATFDSAAIESTGATSVTELLRTIRGATQSADGSEPIFLLNGQRVSGYGEIGTLPPEAIDKVEVLPEQTALRFGYPPTRRVVNFITKRRFRQVELRHAVGTSAQGGGDTANVHAGVTRFHDDARITLEGDYRHADAIRQSERGLLPDPEILFEPVGNVSGLAGGEIDPALSAAAGTVVTAVPVPVDPAARTLAGFAAGANRPRLFDPGPYRTLRPENDTGKVEMVLANRISDTIAGSVNLSAEQSRDRHLGGLAPLTLFVPAGRSPFSRDVLLQRYLIEADPLRFRQTVTTLRAGTTLRGSVAGWRWDLTTAVEQQRTSGYTDRGIDSAAANAAVAAGADPFAPLGSAVLSRRLFDRAALRIRTAGAKVVATNTPLRLPAGNLSVVATAEVERTGAVSVTRGSNPFALSLNRLREEGGLALEVPLASKREGVLPWVGELSVNAAGTLRHVGGFGTLWDANGGITWAPSTAVQLLGQLKRSQAPPALAQQSTPTVQVPNVSVFDYSTGRTALVTLFQGGNPDLLPERRSVSSLTLNLKPFARREWRVSATYSNTVIRDQTATIYAFTPRTEGILSDLFVRDAAGELQIVTFRPTNIAREHTKSLGMTLNIFGQLGKKPPESAAGAPPVERPSFYGGLGPTLLFSDKLQLRPGTAELDRLGGDTITGAGTARISGYGYGGLSYLGNGMNFDFWYNGANRVLGGTNATDLRFAPIFKLNLGVFASVHHFLPRQAWTKRLQIKLEVSNITDARQRVTDGNGSVPNRFQPAFLDPVGRTLTLTLRKLL